ncbi:UNVERIFIED_CONTAM: hypothetical protein Sradi_3951000 [Sesamum radiatum]|uniref:F-box associated beta-propeller type 1 domain-containing protein n=1 Tax=Sesamum radiatum TaxID=300843 RepID=A0AAW2PKI9_SESRA
MKGDTIWKKLPGLDLCEWSDIVGSCDGLVLMVLEEFEKFLVNPFTLELVKVPKSPLALKWKESFSMHGFGYDCSSDDYKVVTLFYSDTENHNSDRVETFVDVFSVRRGVWGRVDSSPYDHDVPQRSPYGFCEKALSPGAFVNGALHWLAVVENWDPRLSLLLSIWPTRYSMKFLLLVMLMCRTLSSMSLWFLGLSLHD